MMLNMDALFVFFVGILTVPGILVLGLRPCRNKSTRIRIY